MCRYVCVCWVCPNIEWRASEGTVVMKMCKCLGDLLTELVYGLVFYLGKPLAMRLLHTQGTKNSTDTNVTHNT